MAESSPKAATENDDTPAAEETLDFDDDTLRGKEKRLNTDLLGNDNLTFNLIVNPFLPRAPKIKSQGNGQKFIP